MLGQQMAGICFKSCKTHQHRPLDTAQAPSPFCKLSPIYPPTHPGCLLTANLGPATPFPSRQRWTRWRKVKWSKSSGGTKSSG